MDIKEIIKNIKFNKDGLVPAIAQDCKNQQVLMMAWMNSESITKTLETKEVYYWSRSRQEIWKKGGTSGHVQFLKQFHLDCDNDTILITVDQVGFACHTYVRSCFFNRHL